MSANVETMFSARETPWHGLGRIVIEADFPKLTCTTAYEITMKSTIVSALITLDTEKQMDERFDCRCSRAF